MRQGKKRTPSPTQPDPSIELPSGTSPPESQFTLPPSTSVIVPVLTFVVALTGYWFTMARTVTLVDSGELILTAATLGVAHPPGVPLYTFLGFFFSQLPIGSMAFRITVMSGVFAALTAAMVTLLTREIWWLVREKEELARRRPSSKKTESAGAVTLRTPWLVVCAEVLIPLGTGLAFAFSKTLWYYASVAEVYSLNLALLSLVIFLVTRWLRIKTHNLVPQAEPRKTWWLIAGATLVYGLALGVHHVTILLTFPAFLALVWMSEGTAFFRSREFAWSIGTVVVGLVVVYAYLPLAALREPVLSWGYPATVERFLWHISGKQYQVNLFSADGEKVAAEFRTFLALLVEQLTPAAVVGMLAGVWVLWHKNRTWLVFFLLVVVLNVAYSINYEIAEDKDAYYLPTHLACALMLGIGFQFLVEEARLFGKAALAVAGVAIVALPVVCFGLHFHENNKRNYLIARDYVENTLRSVAPGGLLLTLDWQIYSPYLYLRHLEGFRTDATVVDVNLMRRSWYVDRYLPRQYPEMMQACAAEKQAFLQDLSLFEHDQPYNAEQIQKHFLALIEAMVKYHLSRQGVWLMLPMEPGVGQGYTWVPEGLTMHVVSESQTEAQRKYTTAPALELRGLLDQSVFLDEVAKGKVAETYSMMIANRGKYLTLIGQPEAAFEQLRLALQLDSDNDRAYEFMGDIYVSQGLLGAAQDAYQTALQFNPNNTSARQSLQRLIPPPAPATPPKP